MKFKDGVSLWLLKYDTVQKNMHREMQISEKLDECPDQNAASPVNPELECQSGRGMTSQACNKNPLS